MNFTGEQTFEKFRTVSATKKASDEAFQVTPIHCAAINPETKYLRELIDGSGGNGDQVQDTRNRKPVHFAAVCSTSDNLKYLIDEANARIDDADTEGITPLMLACRYGAAHNVDLLWPTGENQLDVIKKKKDKEGYNCMYYAVRYGQVECVRKLVERDFKKVPYFPVNKNRETPLMLAAKHGHTEIVKYLVERCGARLIGKTDKFKKTALIHAVKNGNFDIVKLLMENGASPYFADSSDNLPIHYAVAFGWLDITRLLVEGANCKLNSFNAWRYTPLNLAIKKHHNELLDYIFNSKEIDLNARDEHGMTMLLTTMKTKSEETTTMVKFLIERGADVNGTAADGTNVMHMIATTPVRDDDIPLAEYFLEKGFVLINAMNNDKKSPLYTAIDRVNYPMIMFLIKHPSVVLEHELSEESQMLVDEENAEEVEKPAVENNDLVDVLPKSMPKAKKLKKKKAKKYNSDGNTSNEDSDNDSDEDDDEDEDEQEEEPVDDSHRLNTLDDRGELDILRTFVERMETIASYNKDNSYYNRPSDSEELQRVTTIFRFFFSQPLVKHYHENKIPKDSLQDIVQRIIDRVAGTRKNMNEMLQYLLTEPAVKVCLKKGGVDVVAIVMKKLVSYSHQDVSAITSMLKLLLSQEELRACSTKNGTDLFTIIVVPVLSNAHHASKITEIINYLEKEPLMKLPEIEHGKDTILHTLVRRMDRINILNPFNSLCKLFADKEKSISTDQEPLIQRMAKTKDFQGKTPCVWSCSRV